MIAAEDKSYGSIREERGWLIQRRLHGKKIAARDMRYETFVRDGGESEGEGENDRS